MMSKIIRELVLLFSVCCLVVLNFTVATLASPYIVSDLGGDRTIAFYPLSFFGFGTSITIPLSKWLAARVGVKNTFIISLLFFALSSLLCALSSTYFLLIVARFMAGMAVGPIYAMLIRLFDVIVPVEKKHMVSWIFVTILVTMPVFGASLGGTIAYLYDWRFFFAFTAVMSLIFTLLFYYLFYECYIPNADAELDWIGWVFYAVGLASLTFAFVTCQQLDWYRSPLLITAVIIGLPSFGYFFLRCFYHEHPVFHLNFFAKPIFSLAILSLVTLFSVYFGVIFLLSIWLTFDVRFTPNWIAALIAMMGVSGLFPRFIMEEKLIKIDPRIWIAFSTVIFGVSCFYAMQFNTEINFGRIVFSRVLAGIGLAFFVPPIMQILSKSHKSSDWFDIFVLFQAVRNLACGLGGALFSIVWQRRTVFYHERLNEGLNYGSQKLNLFFKKKEVLNVPGSPFATLGTFLDDQASALALEDVFFLMGWILVVLLVLIIFTFFVKKDLFNLDKIKASIQKEEMI